MNHIALVIPGLARIGGAERQTIHLALGLNQRRCRVSVVLLSGDGGDAAIRLSEARVAFLKLGMRKGLADPRGWIRFHNWLRREQPDVVHAHLPHAVWLARWSRLGAPVRAMLDTIHTSSTGGPGRRLGYRYSNWLPDRVTAVSNAVAQAYRSSRMATANKLVLLPNGVDVEQWLPDPRVRAAVRREMAIENEFLWVAAGRLDAVKDYPALLRAMAGLPAHARLVIAGSGPMKAELQRMSEELVLERRVRFLGFEPDVRRWMQAGDAFVLSSRWEGLPMALMEAAACGLPSVATAVPGTDEVVDDGETGILAATGDAAALQAAMARLMSLPEAERRTMGERARQLVTERFSLDAVLDRWEQLYADVLGQNPVARRWGRS